MSFESKEREQNNSHWHLRRFDTFLPLKHAFIITNNLSNLVGE
jgi:hypothetical protein